jgi:hypothetical protein
MTGIQFMGPEDSRVLDGHDLNRAGVEGFHKTEFHKGVPVSVDEGTAEGLMNNPELYGKFELVEDSAMLDIEVEEEEDEKPAKKSTKSSSAK